jgi:hypothetical protein
MLSEWSVTTRKSELRRLSRGRRHLFTARKAVGIRGPQASAEDAGVHREARVEMRVAEERARRVFPVGIGRVGLRTERLVDLLLVGLTRRETRRILGGCGGRQRNAEKQAQDDDAPKGAIHGAFLLFQGVYQMGDV